ncbi:response regulator transcription factor [Flavihumibacter rivuli]|uniref:response regulator transcription factor n=1 Tax=Flavihumibacter rivuli TaxID=2838156 RepID=UPI001BDE95E3|nr:response regulator transcription factor [Flavihumibacter rivuli]ULQ55702.1 response regulator transcription factor [Flavihumibacter rivuli]
MKASDKNTMTVAMVDDHKLLRSGLAYMVNSFEGFKVIFEAGNGKELIEQLSFHPAPDLILLDINMPVMNGYETAAWIRQNLSRTKVVVLSMLDADLAIIRMLNLGARGYLRKDTDPKEFQKSLNQLRRTGFCLNETFNRRMNLRQPIVSQEMDEENAEEPDFFKQAVKVSSLSERELNFLRLVCTDKTYREIAEELNVSPRTVDSYRDSLFEKLGISTRMGLALFAIKNGIVMV